MGATRRGIALTEMALLAPVILLFMSIAYGLWRLTATEQAAFAAAQAAMSRKAVGFQYLSDLHESPEGIPESRVPVVVAVPSVPGAERTLRAVEDLPNYAAHSGASAYMEQVLDISEEFGGYDIWRDGIVVKPSWTFAGYPLVNTQHPSEALEVQDWFFDAREETITPSRRDALGLYN